jgi:hypothetical protein
MRVVVPERRRVLNAQDIETRPNPGFIENQLLTHHA